MKFNEFNRRTLAPLAAFGAVFLAGCDAAPSSAGGSTGQEETASALDPYLANPAEGDLWAAKLDEFSNYDFGEDGEDMGDAYGLLQVVEVGDERVMVITESGAWPNSDGTINELRGDLAAITWDDSETIPVNRADLADLVEKGHILETRRLSE